MPKLYEWELSLIGNWQHWSRDVVVIKAETAGKAKMKLLRQIGDVVPIKFMDIKAIRYNRSEATDGE